MVVSLPPLGFREGFLAATSVFSMFAFLVKAYLGDDALPVTFPEPLVQFPTEAERLLVILDPSVAAVGFDIETRLEELGLATVQVTDLRNFAHGRHLGLARNRECTSVLCIATPDLAPLAEKTASILESSDIDVTSWTSSFSGPLATIELLIASMKMAGRFADSQGVNIARPGASDFGRRLYHLNVGRLLPQALNSPVGQKLDATGVNTRLTALGDQYSRLMLTGSKA